MSVPNESDAEKQAIHRQLKIKAGASKRLLKEHNLYKKEAEEQQRNLDKMTAENAEGWDIRNAKKILEESERMIKDSNDRLGKAVQGLQSLVDSVKRNPDFFEDQELVEAEKHLNEASA
ncbi:tubulin binding cofactor A-domain-containing protein [Melanogaster broomeanus]|nr:tubulin binding cofactor A-domain-containing protein [Melanogaster broomeanus]